MTKVLINGFGRIGRTVLRAWLQGGWPGIEIVGINDIADLETCAYLFAYDSVFGPYPGRVEDGAGALVIDGRAIPLTHATCLRDMDLTGVDLVMECTGRAVDRRFAEAALDGGAGKVLISGPSPQADLTLVLGANDAALTPDHRIVSNASCTTNALAPLLAHLDAAYGVETGFMTTIHCYTGSQPTVDKPRDTLVRSRAAALSMVPTTTSAEKLTDLVLPHLAGRVMGAAVRVPTASVSAVDLTVMLRDTPGIADLNDGLTKAHPVIGTTSRPLVSSDLRARPDSIVMALPESRATPQGMVRVFGWYDNEWGFSCRMLDVAGRMGLASG